MSKRTHAVEVLRRANPNPASATDATDLDERARRDLREILASASIERDESGRPVRRRTVPRQVALAAAASLVGAITITTSVFGGRVGVGTAHAATPPVLSYETPRGAADAAGLLEQISARARALPDTSGRGKYAHVSTESWSLFTRVQGRRVTSAVIPQRRDQWLAPDGSGRLKVTATVPGSSPINDDTALTAGQGGEMWPLGSLSADLAELTSQLNIGHPADTPAERLTAVADAYREMPIPPAVRAAMLEYLAETNGLRIEGEVTDRAGRRGVAFGLDSTYSGLPTRYVLIVDPADARVLGEEQMLTSTAGELHVKIPAVIGYTSFLDAQFVGDAR